MGSLLSVYSMTIQLPRKTLCYCCFKLVCQILRCTSQESQFQKPIFCCRHRRRASHFSIQPASLTDQTMKPKQKSSWLIFDAEDEKVAKPGQKWKILQQQPPEYKRGDRRVIIIDLFAETKRQLTLRNTSLKLFYPVKWNPSQLVFQLSGNPGRNTNTSSSSSNIYPRLKCGGDRKGEIKRSAEVDRTWDEWMFF